HWDLNLPDWAGKKKIAGGDKKGFTVVNTGGIETGWMSAGPNGGEKTAPDGYSFKQGLQVKAYGNDVIVTAYDYKRDKDIKKLLISDAKVAQMAPNVTGDDSKNVIVGATEYMEYNVEGADEWHTYNPGNPPKFDGDKIVYVRHKGEMNLESGLTQLLRFSANK
ncbi:metallophosphoesterase, partial [Bacillus thuringiensis serovar graciosensis]